MSVLVRPFGVLEINSCVLVKWRSIGKVIPLEWQKIGKAEDHTKLAHLLEWLVEVQKQDQMGSRGRSASWILDLVDQD